MRPLKFKIISWLLAFTIGVASTFIVQSCLRPSASHIVLESRTPTPQPAPSTNKIETPPQALPEASPPKRKRTVSLKFSNYSRSEKAEGFYTNEADYPQLTFATTEAARRFNRQVEDLITSHLADARRQGRKLIPERQRNKDDRVVGGVTTSYEILFASPNLISVSFTHSYISTFHPIDSFESFNYDLKAERPLRLRDIFKPNAKYLKALSKASRAKIVETFELSGMDSWLKEGTAPLEKNFQAWNITPEGIVISFRDYQIGPYGMGTVQITVPFKDLGNLLKSDWLHRQKLSQFVNAR